MKEQFSELNGVSSFFSRRGIVGVMKCGARYFDFRGFNKSIWRCAFHFAFSIFQLPFPVFKNCHGSVALAVINEKEHCAKLFFRSA